MRAFLNLRRPLVRSTALAVGAMVLYGCWAIFANRTYGMAVAVRAGATQAAASFTITLSMNGLMEALRRTARTALGRFFRAVAGGIGLSFVLTLGLHLAMGTPELLETVLPSLTIGSVYSILYSGYIARESTRLDSFAAGPQPGAEDRASPA